MAAPKGDVEYSALPLHLLLGAWFSGSRALRLVRSLWLGASLRAGILPGEVDVTVDEELLYLMPNATLSRALDLSWSF